jgi:hypothetical protein
MKKHSHILVIGRPSDGENHWMKLVNVTEKEAVDKFKKDIMEDYEFKADERDIYLEAVIASESPIQVLQYQQ